MKLPFALLLTDTHLKKGNELIVESIFDQAIEYCFNNDIKYIFHLGDFFTSREAQPLDVLLEAENIFRKIPKSGLNFIIIPGNHDKVNLESENSYLNVFSNINGIKLIKTETLLPAFSHTNLFFLPYFKENGSYVPRLNEIASRVDNSTNNILFTHIAVNSVINNDGSLVDNGVPMELFEKFTHVFVGHYHNKSTIGSNIHYIGSSHQNNFGEDDRKGFTVLYEDNGSITFEQIVSEFPRYINISVSANASKEEINQIKKSIKKSDNFKLVVDGTTEECKAFDKEKFEQIGVKVDFVKEDSRIVSGENFVNYDRKNIKKYFDEFCEKNDLKNKEIGINYLKQIL